jgi:flagellar hook-associated protein 3 FlgL
MRVTQGMIFDSANQSIGTTLSALQKATEKVSSQKRLNRPSDDPADVRSAVQMHDALSELNQFLRNIDVASSKVDAQDTALGSAGDLLQRANELAIEGANGAMDGGNRMAIAQEVSQLIESMAQGAGAKVNDEYIFSGFRVDRPPYTVTGPGTASAYQGDHGITLARVGPASTIQISVSGDAIFQPALDALAQLKTDLESGNPVQPATITKIQGALDNLLGARAQIGARANRLEQAKTSQAALVTSGQALLSQLEDVDMPAAITEMTKRQTTYQATLAVTAKVMQTSLIDYLR